MILLWHTVTELGPPWLGDQWPETGRALIVMRRGAPFVAAADYDKVPYWTFCGAKASWGSIPDFDAMRTQVMQGDMWAYLETLP